MKYIVRTIQILVGVLFIFSGLVKANDPLGLAYKMEEFFTVWTDGLNSGHFFAKNFLIDSFHFLNEHSLFLAIVMITLEIVAGVALLIGWRKKFVLSLLFVLIVFFTFLTGYAYLAKDANGGPKFTNCGCFGDCLPITPLTSFLKDLALTLMIFFLIAGRNYIRSISSTTFRWNSIFLSLIATLFIQWYVLNYLPFVDCLPMKKGNHLSEQIKPPKDAVPSIYETRLVYQNSKSGAIKDMDQTEYNNSHIWEDSSWKWKATNTKLIRRGTDVPRLQNFVLSTADGNDTTEAILNDPHYQVLYFVNAGKNSNKMDTAFANKITEKKLNLIFITTNRTAFPTNETHPVLTCDGTVFRIAARVNPTIYLVKQGTIINKWPLAKKNLALKFISDLKP